MRRRGKQGKVYWKIHIIGFTLLLVIVALMLGWIKFRENTPESTLESNAIAEAQQMSGQGFEVRRGSKDGKPSTDLVLHNSANKTDYDFVPCTDEQKKLIPGDKIRVRFVYTSLAHSEDPVGKKYCYLLLF